MANNTDAQKKAYNNGFAAQDSFRTLNANLLASFNSDGVADSLLAHIRLEHQDELFEHNADFSFLVTLLERSFLNLYDRGVIAPNAPLTSRGENELQSMRARTGIREIGYEAPPTQEEIAQSVEQDLRAQIEFDWLNIGADAVRLKAANDVAYRNMLNQMLEGDSIGSSATTYTRIAGAPDGNQYGRR